MTTDATVKLTISLIDPELDAEELDEETQQLWIELNQLEEVEKVERVADPNPPEGSKAIVSSLVGLLKAEVSISNGLKLIRFLGNCFKGRSTIEISGEVKGKKFKIKVGSSEELPVALEAYEKIMNMMN
ncbi:MAG: hypothetical protein KA717_15885 [Woronichinia naegeliana WA131]|jgi:hypothetical protein|uniref:Uncharacterized protein n=1 Tax=Woronichinia naegeliana WA131 TaxID=2824559 RepID=A0A977L1P7_9CYAN|nr:MAG: hypothetical protein KA717_15885 [Woronichinia naegeliana WA131]